MEEKLKEAIRIGEIENKVFVCDSDKEWTYGQLKCFVLTVEAFFRENNVKRVMICLPQGFYGYGIILGAYLSGVTFCSIHYENPLARVQYYFDAYSPDVFITDKHDIIVGISESISIETILKKEDCLSKSWSCCNYKNDDIAYVMFTSGSTGYPKGVMISRQSLNSFLFASIDVWGLMESDVVGQYSSLGFDLSVADIFLTCVARAKLIPVWRKSQKLMPAKVIQKNKITFWHSVPSVIDVMSKANQLKSRYLETIRKISFCGERLYQSQLDLLFKECDNIVVINTYGPTETTIFCSYAVMDSSDYMNYSDKTITIGKPIDRMSMSIWNQQEDIGELVLSGENISVGYIGGENSEAFFIKDGIRCYKTGDYVYQKDGALYFYGRRDTQIKYMGNRIDLSEIDEAIRKLGYPSVSIYNKDRIVSFVRTDQTQKDAIFSYLKTVLPEYYLPKTIIVVENFEYSSSGKIDVNKLQIKYTDCL